MDKKGNFIILFLCAAGGVLGMFLFSKPLMLVIETYPMPSMYFFMGAVVGSIPLIFRMSKLKKFSIRGLFYILIGAALILPGISVSFVLLVIGLYDETVAV